MDINYLHKRLRATEALTADLLMLIGKSLPFLADQAAEIATRWRDTVQGLEKPNEEVPQAVGATNGSGAGPSRVSAVKTPPRIDLDQLVQATPAEQLDQGILQSMTASGLENLSELAASGNMRAGALVSSLIDDLRKNGPDAMGFRSGVQLGKQQLTQLIVEAIQISYPVRAAAAAPFDQSLLRKGAIESIEETPSDFVTLTPGAVTIFLNLRENQFLFTHDTGTLYHRGVSNNWSSVDDSTVFEINPLVLKAELSKLSTTR